MPHPKGKRKPIWKSGKQCLWTGNWNKFPELFEKEMCLNEEVYDCCDQGHRWILRGLVHDLPCIIAPTKMQTGKEPIAFQCNRYIENPKGVDDMKELLTKMDKSLAESRAAIYHITLWWLRDDRSPKMKGDDLKYDEVFQGSERSDFLRLWMPVRLRPQYQDPEVICLTIEPQMKGCEPIEEADEEHRQEFRSRLRGCLLCQ